MKRSPTSGRERGELREAAKSVRGRNDAQQSATKSPPAVPREGHAAGSLSHPPEHARRRLWIEGVRPQIDGGRWPVKRELGDRMVVEADLVCDGHDAVAGVVLYRPHERASWREIRLEFVSNDRWRAAFEVSSLGWWQYTVEAWVDAFTTWREALTKKAEAGQDVSLDLIVGAELVARAANRAEGKERDALSVFSRTLASTQSDVASRVNAAADPRLAALVAVHPDRSNATRLDRIFEVRVDRPRARFSAWYELFPRSAGPASRHGTFRDVENLLPYVASMGFDVVYLPPIHPIGTTYRKGRNNALVAGKGDPGSPWGIGSAEGGHKAVHPELGTLADLRRLVKSAERHGLEIALDVALQVSPDHPYVRDHPEWFRKRPDGTIQYAENPPKKYQDIYPFDFSCDAWPELWTELHDIFSFWIEQGIRLFRVDNPHTKPLGFWEWCLRDLQDKHPDVLFLAEAFTRPKLMYALAKAGFSQSYTYFTWRTTGWELREYLEELTTTEIGEFFRPNFWPNTPDILPEHLQFGGRAAFIVRLVLASVLSSNYGVYGPAFELMEHVARPGSEEYLDNEKYEIRTWDLESARSLRPLIATINRARRECAALQTNANLRFHRTDNEQLLCFSKHADDRSSCILVVVNLDFHYEQAGWTDLDMNVLGLGWEDSFQVHDLLTDARYLWKGPRNYVELDPHDMPVHVFRLRRFVRREQDFVYYE